MPIAKGVGVGVLPYPAFQNSIMEPRVLSKFNHLNTQIGNSSRTRCPLRKVPAQAPRLSENLGPKEGIFDLTLTWSDRKRRDSGRWPMGVQIYKLFRRSEGVGDHDVRLRINTSHQSDF